MPFNHQIERIQRMHKLIQCKQTGPPDCFAQKLGISRSLVYQLIQELKQMGAPIIYCKYRESFKYQYEVEFKFGFEPPNLSPIEASKVVAGWSMGNTGRFYASTAFLL